MTSPNKRRPESFPSHSFLVRVPYRRQCAAAGRPGADLAQGALHRGPALQPGASPPVCRRLRGLPRLRPGGGAVPQQGLGRSGRPGEEVAPLARVFILCAAVKVHAHSCKSNSTDSTPLPK